MLLGLVASVALTSESLAMIVAGILLGLVGTDVNSGAAWFTFGSLRLMDGIDFALLAMGLFGIAEIMANIDDARTRGHAAIARVGNLSPTREDRRRMWPTILRGTGIGAILGILPGAGATISSFAAYAVEKKVSRHAAEMGHGAIEGVAAPEAANNAAAQCNSIPLLTLGIPGSANMALMVGAMMIHDIQPGPQVISAQPALFWGLVVSMWIGNLILLVLNLPLIGVWVSLLRVPNRLLYPAVVLFCCVGAYSLKASGFDIFIMSILGILGYLLVKLDMPVIPLLQGFVLGPLMETTLRRTLMISRGDFGVFVQSPISLVLLCTTAGIVIYALLPKRARQVK